MIDINKDENNNKFKLVILWKGYPVNAWAYDVMDISKCKYWEEGYWVDTGHDLDLEKLTAQGIEALKSQIIKRSNMYSQNNEEAVIAGHFGQFKGHLLSLGENDGITLSNARTLIEKGWTADLVEPSPVAFGKLFQLYGQNPQVRLHNVAIGNKNGKMPFYDSGTLLKQGDEALVSTLSKEETKRWGNSVNFSEIEVDVVTVEKLLENTIQKTFDLISIDCEGLDLDILRQMDLDAMGAKCVCVEFNGKDQHLYFEHVRKYGFLLIHKNAENLIYVR